MFSSPSLKLLAKPWRRSKPCLPPLVLRPGRPLCSTIMFAGWSRERFSRTRPPIFTQRKGPPKLPSPVRKRPPFPRLNIYSASIRRHSQNQSQYFAIKCAFSIAHMDPRFINRMGCFLSLRVVGLLPLDFLITT